MNHRETKALTREIERYITKNIYKVQTAQLFSKKILEYGLIDVNKTVPFQILPTELSDSEGNLICKLYVFLESPLYGFFSIEILEDNISISCPVTYHTDHILMTYEMCDMFIDDLNTLMDDFYQLQSAAENGSDMFCSLFLNQMLEKYNKNIKTPLENIKQIINENDKIAIISNKFYALVKDAQTSYDQALLMPTAWAVFKDVSSVPEQGEDLEEYIDEPATNELFEHVNKFFRTENYWAAPLYLAQRICLQSGFKVSGFLKSEETWKEAKINTDMGEFVLPAIDLKELKVN